MCITSYATVRWGCGGAAIDTHMYLFARAKLFMLLVVCTVLQYVSANLCAKNSFKIWQFICATFVVYTILNALDLHLCRIAAAEVRLRWVPITDRAHICLYAALDKCRNLTNSQHRMTQFALFNDDRVDLHSERPFTLKVYLYHAYLVCMQFLGEWWTHRIYTIQSCGEVKTRCAFTTALVFVHLGLCRWYARISNIVERVNGFQNACKPIERNARTNFWVFSQQTYDPQNRRFVCI